jgi:hypothetical protein
MPDRTRQILQTATAIAGDEVTPNFGERGGEKPIRYNDNRPYHRPNRYEREVAFIELPLDVALKLLERAMEKLAERLGYWTIHQYKLLYEAMYDAVCATEQYIIQLARRK